MFLANWSGKHARVAEATSWEELLARASSTILGLDVTPGALERFNVTDLAPTLKTCVHLAVLRRVRFCREGRSTSSFSAERRAEELAASRLGGSPSWSEERAPPRFFFKSFAGSLSWYEEVVNPRLFQSFSNSVRNH